MNLFCEFYKAKNIIIWCNLLILLAPLATSQPINIDPDLTSYKDVRNPDLSYEFSYETVDGQTREETGTFEEVNGQKLLVVRGKYSYIGPDGNIYSVTYVADQNGYQAITDPHRATRERGDFGSVGLLGKRINPNLVSQLVGG